MGRSYMIIYKYTHNIMAMVPHNCRGKCISMQMVHQFCDCGTYVAVTAVPAECVRNR